MITRFVMLMLIAVLALPVATLTRPEDTNPSPWSDIAVDAKGKKHKKGKKPRYKTVRQEVTRTFTNTETITIPGGGSGTIKGPASPYPSPIMVSGFSNGVITDVNLLLDDLTHGHPGDVDMLLSREDGRRALVMSDVGTLYDVLDLDLTFDDEAAAEIPGDTALSSGTFRPTNFGEPGADDSFEAPAPGPDGTVALSAFDGADLNGRWQLWVRDDANTDHGTLGGWSLQITAEVDVKVKHKKHKKRS
jgi:hypothetical protein